MDNPLTVKGPRQAATSSFFPWTLFGCCHQLDFPLDRSVTVLTDRLQPLFSLRVPCWQFVKKTQLLSLPEFRPPSKLHTFQIAAV